MESELIISKQDKLIIRAMIATEWMLCLFSPRHAAKTWLRIDPQVEEKYLKRLKRAVIGLFVILAFMIGISVGQYRVIHYLQTQQPEPLKVQFQTREI